MVKNYEVLVASIQFGKTFGNMSCADVWQLLRTYSRLTSFSLTYFSFSMLQKVTHKHVHSIILDHWSVFESWGVCVPVHADRRTSDFAHCLLMFFNSHRTKFCSIILQPRSRPRLMKRQCSTKMCYEKTILDSFEL